MNISAMAHVRPPVVSMDHASSQFGLAGDPSRHRLADLGDGDDRQRDGGTYYPLLDVEVGGLEECLEGTEDSGQERAIASVCACCAQLATPSVPAPMTRPTTTSHSRRPVVRIGWPGLRGWRSMMVKTLAPRKEKIKPNRHPIWNRMYL